MKDKKKLETTGISIKLEDNFQHTKVRNSLDLLPSEKKPLLVKIIKQPFKLSGNCPNGTQQMKKHLFKKFLTLRRTT